MNKKLLIVNIAVMCGAIIFSILLGLWIRDRNSRFRVVERLGGGYSVIVDRETGIGYLGIGSRVQTVLYDADGNIYRPNGWRDYGR